MSTARTPPGGPLPRRLGILAATTVAAGAGGGGLHALGVPGGMLVGAMAAVALVGLLGYPTFRHPAAKPVAQILVGTGIGATISRDSVGLVVTMAVPMLITVVALLLFGAVFGLWLARTTSLDRRTALTATMPGGMVEMVMIADELGADVAVVAGIHLMRIVSVLISLPVVLTVLR